MDLSALSYQKFVHFALEETQRRTTLAPLPSQEKFRSIKAKDDKTMLHGLSFSAPKIRLLRSLTIEGSEAVKVLDFAAFSKPEFDLPIFCANFFLNASLSIVVLDLNPLYDVTIRSDYKDKYYIKLMSLGQKYAEVSKILKLKLPILPLTFLNYTCQICSFTFLSKTIQLLPWGGKVTSESLRFFSPIVIWSMLSSKKYKHDILYSAFMDYFQTWLELMDQAVEETDALKILRNREAQHKYLTWRAEKDPGHPILKRLIGEKLAKDLLRNFLFEGVDTLGTRTFLDYFPEYRCKDGSINQRRSIIGKSYETRPWDAKGEFIGSEPG
ncbi:phytochromobilin:ferredoxin oxidoreductase, chloroplastic isoform X1 [Phoenix dactylifera]|uniref:Phytochromobilin:ferredoxin oxidoreductase, chloroplastic isoform X1 n=1 Tax=Phoenix dactylifera TaxID=42345 RepID=A0A8B8ZFG4_PHODC|nr:phytochromobilin:ferredoxin oxidoreductase, chloroplastic isoform X1 [Phoenix dactylifera]